MFGREHVRQVDGHALVELRLPGVIANVRAAVDEAGEVVFVVSGIAAVHRGLVADVPVHARDRGVGVLRRSRAGI